MLGGAIGAERELNDQAAGLRTRMLLTIGACLFTLVSAYGFGAGPRDPSRLAAQIVTGIGSLDVKRILEVVRDERAELRGLDRQESDGEDRTEQLLDLLGRLDGARSSGSASQRRPSRSGRSAGSQVI